MKDKLTRDASDQYRHDLGWKKTATDYTQHRFYLGQDRDRARGRLPEIVGGANKDFDNELLGLTFSKLIRDFSDLAFHLFF